MPTDPDEILQFLHLHFRSFLLNTETALRVEKRAIHQKILVQCLRIMDNFLKQNICGLPSYAAGRKHINGLTIDRCLPEHLQYSCCHWVYHLKQSHEPVKDEVCGFLEKHLLHWMETMSIMGMVLETVGILNTLMAVLMKSDSKLSEFLHDAQRFILRNMQIASSAPLQLYYSGIAFAPEGSVIRKKFEEKPLRLMAALPTTTQSWSALLRTLEGHSDRVNTVAFSPDGQRVASSSRDQTVRLWDAKTGRELLMLHGHTASVNTMAFSPDGQIVASGSLDGSIRLWDTKTGKELQPSHHYTGIKDTMAFSPDGQIVASVSYDDSIRLWEAKTGRELQKLQGHSDWVNTVAFSPDSQLVASGSDDKTIQLWDTKTGRQYQTLRGHSSRVRTVVFSPDGQMLASGSDDKTIQLWDTKTGRQYQTLRGHSGRVKTVLFSPDGQMVASGSNDECIQLWDAKTGRELQRLRGYSILSNMVFSPDGQILASGSHDETIRLWDTKTGKDLQVLQASNWVSTVTFSPDSQIVASGSNDGTVQLWDTKSGSESQMLQGHSDLVNTMVFSPDGQILASGSCDETIRLWDAETGALREVLHAKKAISSIRFSMQGPYLETDNGSFRIQPFNSDHHPVRDEHKPQVSLVEDWVVLGGVKVLWLPFDYRQPSCSAIKDRALALGYPDGRVCILQFHREHPSLH